MAGPAVQDGLVQIALIEALLRHLTDTECSDMMMMNVCKRVMIQCICDDMEHVRT